MFLELSNESALLAAKDVAQRCKEHGITAVHVKLHNKTRTRAGARSALRTIARCGMKFGCIDDVIPIPTDSTCRKGGRGRRRL